MREAGRGTEHGGRPARRRAEARREARPRRCCPGTPTRPLGRRSRSPASSPPSCARTPPWSSPRSPTPRRRARSPTPTGGCSGCARRSATRARCSPAGGCWPSSATACGAGVDTRDASALFEAVKKEVPFYGSASRSRRSAAAGCAGRTPTPPRSCPPRSPPTIRSRSRPSCPRDCKLGAAPSLWSGPVTAHAPSLRFLAPEQRAELAPADAQRLGLASGDEVLVAPRRERARRGRPAAGDGARAACSSPAPGERGALTNGAPTTVEVRKA